MHVTAPYKSEVSLADQVLPIKIFMTKNGIIFAMHHHDWDA